uniref:Uncharacterized protein n=1 Tax=Physcomitrium patens TaxID=3218 RepID=A0A2K1L4B1_PHYPA|nr:hypothetical protein PHYPA_003655 [Physcomitrium patens]
MVYEIKCVKNPSGTATGILISSFHTQGAFKCFFSGIGDSCGFDQFPSLSLKAMTYLGAGIICPHILNISVLLRAVLSWGVFIAIAVFLGDGLNNFVAILYKSDKELYFHHTFCNQLSVAKSGIPPWMVLTGYVVLAAISVAVIPQIFEPVLICYTFAPILAYGCGLTDWSLASTYGKLALFTFGAWAGSSGGVLVGLAVCASDLIQDFKIGYLTLSSPRSMFVSQLIGCAMGCVLAPLTFWLFWSAFPSGDPNGSYKLCYNVFAAAVVINILRHTLPKRISKWIPIPMAMAIPCYIGGYFAIDMFVGSIIRLVYEKINKHKSDIMSPAIAAGLICGDGVWTILSVMLALSKFNPPLACFSRSPPILWLL